MEARSRSMHRPSGASRRQVLRAIATGAAAAAVATPTRADPVVIRLRRGMNLWPWFSLTREFPPPRTDYDWPPYQDRRAVPGGRDLMRLRSAGIDFVRIPVDPGPLMAFSGVRQRQLIEDVAAAVELARTQDLSVIVDLHPNGATHYFNPRNLMRAPDDPLFVRFLGVVRDVAAGLARFDPSGVAFEPLNEPPQGCAAVAWPVMQAAIVRAARASASRLTLVVTGACGSMIAGLEALDPKSIGDDNVIYTFHFYEPYVFSHQGAPWMTGEPMYHYLNAVPWPSSAGTRETTRAAVARRMAADTTTPAATRRQIAATIDRVLAQYFDARPDRRYIERFFRRVSAWADRHAIDRNRILLGEFGALRTDQRYVAAPAPDRARYIRDVRETAESLGMPWAFWNFFDGMGLTSDDELRELDPAVTAALGLRLPG
jgi:hypothetical protein